MKIEIAIFYQYLALSPKWSS